MLVHVDVLEDRNPRANFVLVASVTDASSIEVQEHILGATLDVFLAQRRVRFATAVTAVSLRRRRCECALQAFRDRRTVALCGHLEQDVEALLGFLKHVAALAAPELQTHVLAKGVYHDVDAARIHVLSTLSVCQRAPSPEEWHLLPIRLRRLLPLEAPLTASG